MICWAISPHSVQDGWLSQQAYMLDIWERIPVWVLHDRADITGNNNDATFRERASLEGRPLTKMIFTVNTDRTASTRLYQVGSVHVEQWQ
jgi:hypothetical protein